MCKIINFNTTNKKFNEMIDGCKDYFEKETRSKIVYSKVPDNDDPCILKCCILKNGKCEKEEIEIENGQYQI